MSPPSKSQSAASSRAGASASPALPSFNTEMAGTLGEAGSAYLRGVVTLNQEITDFINKRLEHDAELSRKLGKCKDWKEATELQQNWFREASEEYAHSARTLMELTTRIMNETWAPLQRKAGEDTGSAES
ncbi:MAG TPA: phasin family protein [Gammaproteobacteria bacterium]|nr:phasin family protein [Gammaproteobacteria bacterium]